jgi:hypothetical protein
VKKIKREPDLLDFFAAYALGGMVLKTPQGELYKGVCDCAYQWAGHMIEARERFEKERTEK